MSGASGLRRAGRVAGRGAGGGAGWRAAHAHVAQLFHHVGDGAGVIEGANDCAEASAARYLREVGYPFAGGDDALVAWLRGEITGAADRAGQGYTSLADLAAGLARLGVGARWASSYAEARSAAWALLWVRAGGCRLDRAVVVDGAPRWQAYPSWWLPAPERGADHIILRMPDGTVNDPLASYVADCRYTETSLAGATAGGFILDGAWLGPRRPPTPPPPPSPPGVTPPTRSGQLVVVARDGLHVREAPTLAAPVLATLPAGARVPDVYESACLWSFVEARGQHGWVRREFVRKA